MKTGTKMTLCSLQLKKITVRAHTAKALLLHEQLLLSTKRGRDRTSVTHCGTAGKSTACICTGNNGFSPRSFWWLLCERKPVRQAPLKTKPVLCLWVSGGTGRELPVPDSHLPHLPAPLSQMKIWEMSPHASISRLKNKIAEEFKSGAKCNSSGSSSPGKRKAWLHFMEECLEKTQGRKCDYSFIYTAPHQHQHWPPPNDTKIHKQQKEVFSGLTKPLQPQSVKVYSDKSMQVFHSFAAKEIGIYSENSRLNVRGFFP